MSKLAVLKTYRSALVTGQGVMRFGVGWIDWRHLYHPAPAVIDLEPRVEVFHGEPRVVWST